MEQLFISHQIGHHCCVIKNHERFIFKYPFRVPFGTVEVPYTLALLRKLGRHPISNRQMRYVAKLFGVANAKKCRLCSLTV